jgi:hypothetical protein
MPDRRQPRAENSRRLADLLRAIREDYFEMTQAEMAAVLQQYARKTTTGDPVIKITPATVHNLENLDIGVKFSHLESYGRALGMPSGIILLVSWFSTTTQPQRDLHGLKTLLKRFIEVSDRAAKDDRPLGVLDLRKLSGLVVQQPPYTNDAVSIDDLPKDASQLERLEVAKLLVSQRRIDPLKGLGLFDQGRDEESEH